jgi:hypothetical protein
VLIALSVAGECLADRSSDYVPLPYWTRVGRSLFTIAPMVLCAAVISYVSMWLIDRTRASSKKWRFFGIVLALTFAAVVFATDDAWNDEG